MPLDTDERLEEYLRHESALRRTLQIDPQTIVGGTADAALSAMRAELEDAAREISRLEGALLEAEDEATEATRIARTAELAETALEGARQAERICGVVSDFVDYRDGKLDRRSRTRCLRPAGHDGPHEGILGSGRPHEWGAA